MPTCSPVNLGPGEWCTTMSLHQLHFHHLYFNQRFQSWSVAYGTNKYLCAHCPVRQILTNTTATARPNPF